MKKAQVMHSLPSWTCSLRQHRSACVPVACWLWVRVCMFFELKREQGKQQNVQTKQTNMEWKTFHALVYGNIFQLPVQVMLLVVLSLVTLNIFLSWASWIKTFDLPLRGIVFPTWQCETITNSLFNHTIVSIISLHHQVETSDLKKYLSLNH